MNQWNKAILGQFRFTTVRNSDFCWAFHIN
ncbi:hypothetical protein YPPY08_3393, partial [Yersinia pestis PY-08]